MEGSSIYTFELIISNGAYGTESGDFSSEIVHAEVVPDGDEVVTDGDILELVASLLADGIPAAPEYAFAVTPKWKYGPVCPPVRPGPDIPAIAPSLEGSVNIIDAFGEGDNDAAAFHGNFVEGIINRLGVGSEMKDVGFEDSNFVPEYEVVEALADGVNNVSLGGHDCLASGGFAVPPPIGIAAALRETEDILVVASAGNASKKGGRHGDDFPAHYASFDSALMSTLDPAVQPYYGDIAGKVVSVGALSATNSADYTRASFSNCGDNTVWAPGVGIVSDYGSGTAVWAGTSFAAPVVAAALVLGEFTYP